MITFRCALFIVDSKIISVCKFSVGPHHSLQRLNRTLVGGEKKEGVCHGLLATHVSGEIFLCCCGVGEGGDGECGDVCGEGEDSGGGSWLAAEWLQLVVAVQGRVVRGSLHQSTNQPHTTPTTSYYTTPTTSYYTTLPTSN